jgi:hypothetical protein
MIPWMRMRNKMLIVCSVLVVSLKTTMEKSGYNVQIIADGRTYFVQVRRKILFVCLVRGAWHVLRLWMEEWPPMWRVAANI